MKIRNFKQADYNTILDWWIRHGEVGPTREMMPPESSFVCEWHGDLVYAVTVYLTNSKQFCMVDNFVRNPDFKNKDLGRMFVGDLQRYIEIYARELGFLSIMCMSKERATTRRYMDLGYATTTDGATTLVKSIIQPKEKPLCHQ